MRASVSMRRSPTSTTRSRPKSPRSRSTSCGCVFGSAVSPRCARTDARPPVRRRFNGCQLGDLHDHRPAALAGATVAEVCHRAGAAVRPCQRAGRSGWRRSTCTAVFPPAFADDDGGLGSPVRHGAPPAGLAVLYSCSLLGGRASKLLIDLRHIARKAFDWIRQRWSASAGRNIAAATPSAPNLEPEPPGAASATRPLRSHPRPDAECDSAATDAPTSSATGRSESRKSCNVGGQRETNPGGTPPPRHNSTSAPDSDGQETEKHESHAHDEGSLSTAIPLPSGGSPDKTVTDVERQEPERTEAVPVHALSTTRKDEKHERRVPRNVGGRRHQAVQRSQRREVLPELA